MDDMLLTEEIAYSCVPTDVPSLAKIHHEVELEDSTKSLLSVLSLRRHIENAYRHNDGFYTLNVLRFLDQQSRLCGLFLGAFRSMRPSPPNGVNVRGRIGSLLFRIQNFSDLLPQNPGLLDILNQDDEKQFREFCGELLHEYVPPLEHEVFSSLEESLVPDGMFSADHIPIPLKRALTALGRSRMKSEDLIEKTGTKSDGTLRAYLSMAVWMGILETTRSDAQGQSGYAVVKRYLPFVDELSTDSNTD